MYAIDHFCNKRKTGKKIRDAFTAYCKASISDYYQIKSGETVTGLLMKFTEEEIADLWDRFVIDLKKSISK